MIYNYQNVPTDTVIWACAYTTNNSEKGMLTFKKPVRGIVRDRKFYELKKNGGTKSISVSYYARSYADTEGECIEVYNKMVKRQINWLKYMIEQHEQDLIVGGNTND